MNFLPTAIAYGYLMGTDVENGIQYCIGKGQTLTSVSASPEGTGVLIQGTVMDQSPGQPNTPAVSDSDMSMWMDYLHGQNATMINSPPSPHGVPVELRAVGSDAASLTATATSDSSGRFSNLWSLPTTGLYTIWATSPEATHTGVHMEQLRYQLHQLLPSRQPSLCHLLAQ